jgi:hydroxymethylglutaryl-CoA lyase
VGLPIVDNVLVYEVGPRDGLQSEPDIVSTVDKVNLIDALSASGLRSIEVTSFVSSKWVPQFADADDVARQFCRMSGCTYSALTPNIKGLDRALKANLPEVAVFAAASEEFSRRNINCSIDESFERFIPVVEKAGANAVRVRGYVSCVVACPYAGATAPHAVATVVRRLLDAGCYSVSLGDTIGQGTPATIAAMLDAVLEVCESDQLAGHFHDTNGRALDNVDVAIERGLRTFDGAVAGLGGCPYAPGATGNLSTRRLVTHLHDNGFETGVALDGLAEAEAMVSHRKANRQSAVSH